MKHLDEILADVPCDWIKGDGSVVIKGVEIDSRKVVQGSLFIAVRGAHTDGHRYIENAIENGAVAVMLESIPDGFDGAEVAIIKVADTRRESGPIAAVYFDHPSKSLQLIGVTGTNGKTSVATMLHQLLILHGKNAGLLSTIENKIGHKVLPSSLTTPDPISLQKLLAQMVVSDCSHVVMEVSSHALDQLRTAGSEFALAIFTNVTHDHLDYHGSFDAYIQAKKSFFDDLGLESVALMNKDDRHADVLSQNTVARCHTYALKKPADYKARIIENSISGLQLDLDGWEVHCRLIGSFNAYNLLAVYAAARLLEIDQVVALQYLSQLEPPRGRFQTVRDNSKKVTAIIDYAHTPDALKNVLQTIQQIKQSSTEIITVVGCGGDRDKTKRPKMAQIADAYSNQIIITSDNPRSEDPPKIISDMLDGLDADGRRKALNIVDRREAIKTAYHLASADAVILIAGKGHEVYQEIRGQRLPFDDVEIIKDCMMV